MVLEDLPANLYIRDNEGLGLLEHAGNGVTEIYLKKRFRCVPKLLDIVARVVASLVRTDINLDSVILPEPAKERVLIYVSEYKK